MSEVNLEGQKIGGNKFLIEKYVTKGSFGKLYSGKNLKTNESIAIKIELRENPAPQLPLEFNFYKILGSGQRGIPKIHYFGPIDKKYHALVMDFLGPSLDDIHKKCNSKFSLKTTVLLALQFMDTFEYFHGQRLVYRDVKPENFLLGVTGSDNYFKIFVIDLGLCKEYKNENGVHIPYIEGKGITGTARYMSINNHLGREQSRRDDLEAIGYMFVYLFKGELPWQGVDAPTQKDKIKKIGKIKNKTKPELLCEGMPEQFVEYLKTVKSLAFEEDPNYHKYMDLFKKVLTKKGFKNDDVYDWDRNHNKRK